MKPAIGFTLVVYDLCSATDEICKFVLYYTVIFCTTQTLCCITLCCLLLSLELFASASGRPTALYHYRIDILCISAPS